MSDDYDYEDAARVQSLADARRAQADDRAAELAAIRSRAEQELYAYDEECDGDDIVSAYLLISGSRALDITEPSGAEMFVLEEVIRGQWDRRTLLTLLDDLERERDAIAAAAEAAVTALNSSIQRLADQRDSAYAQMKAARDYLERLPSRTPERERMITAMTAQLGPAANVARIDELP